MDDQGSVSVLQHLTALLEAHERRFDEMVESQGKALLSQIIALRERTDATAQTAEKAVVHAYEAQKSYNEMHNGLLRAMERQAAGMVNQDEHSRIVGELKDRIGRLENAVSASGGVKEWMWKIGVAISLALWLWGAFVK